MTDRLTDKQYQQLTNVIANAFPTPMALAQMVQFTRGENIFKIVISGAVTDMSFELIRSAEAQGGTLDRIFGAQEANLGSPDLLDFVRQIGLKSYAGPANSLV